MAKVLRIDKRLPDTWEDALGDFLTWKQGQGVAPRTLRDYREHVTQFFTRFPDAWNPSNLRQRVLEYMADDIAPATFNLRRQYLKAFFTWCVQEGLSVTVSRQIAKTREERVLPIPPAVADAIRQLLNARHPFRVLSAYLYFLITHI